MTNYYSDSFPLICCHAAIPRNQTISGTKTVQQLSLKRVSPDLKNFPRSSMEETSIYRSYKAENDYVIIMHFLLKLHHSVDSCIPVIEKISIYVVKICYLWNPDYILYVLSYYSIVAYKAVCKKYLRPCLSR